MPKPPSLTPYPQLVREFFDAPSGLPSNSIGAVAVLSNGTVLAVSGSVVVSLKRNADAWRTDTGPTNVAALLALPVGSKVGQALAASPDGVWARKGNAWSRMPGSPTDAVSLAVEVTTGAPWALTPTQSWRYQGGWLAAQPLDATTGAGRALAPNSATEVSLAAANGLFRLDAEHHQWIEIPAASADVRDVTFWNGNQFAAATNIGLLVFTANGSSQLLTGPNGGVPLPDITRLTRADDGSLWLGTDQGLMRYYGNAWTYFASLQWMPDNQVTGIAAVDRSEVWVGTPAGLSHIDSPKITLQHKADLMQKQLESRNRRNGFVTVIFRRDWNDYTDSYQEISDNDGLWTSMYVASQCFRYAVTKEPKAKAQAWKSMQAMLRLEEYTGISGFPARAIANENEPHFADRSTGQWHPSPVAPGWWWKGDTSSDEIVGHFLAFYCYYKLVANKAEKALVSATCKRIMDHIIDHGWYLVDLDGLPTRWGVWAPERLNDDPNWAGEKGNCMLILSHLKVASMVVGDPRYAAGAKDLIENHHYAQNVADIELPDSSIFNHSDEELGYLAFYPLLQLETDPVIRGLYMKLFEALWQYIRPESAAPWNLIYGACTGKPSDLANSLRTLQEIPLDLSTYVVRNSIRADLVWDPNPDRFGSPQLLKALSWIERPLHKWNGNPYGADGGDTLNHREEDQTMWLLPYWLGRYHRLV